MPKERKGERNGLEIASSSCKFRDDEESLKPWKTCSIFLLKLPILMMKSWIPACNLTQNHQFEVFCAAELSHDDKYLLAMFLQYDLCKTVGKGYTEASELAGLMIGKRQWRDELYENNCKITSCEKDQYQLSGVLWTNEMLNEKVFKYVQHNAAVKDRPNPTT